MPIPTEALELENRHIGTDGEPTLGDAFNILRGAWRAGDRDRELCLHLLFLCWYGLVEPSHLTGFEGSEFDDVQTFFMEVLDYVEPTIRNDAEMLYVVGLGAHLFDYVFLGDASEWMVRSDEYRRLYRDLCPNGLDPNIFVNRGYYGEYYFGQARIANGY